MAESILSADRLHRLIESQLEIDLSVGDALVRVADEAQRILGEPVIFLGRRGREWTVEAASPDAPDIMEQPDARSAASEVVDASMVPRMAVWRDAGGAPWTFIGVTSPAFAVALGGNWMLSSQRLILWARTVARTRRLASRAAATRLRVAAHRLTLRLTRSASIHEVCDLVVRSIADAVQARLAAVAVPGVDQMLSIVATHGYPLDLVKHVHIQPGEGVIGTVFATGRMIHGKNAREIPGWRPRPRYRSDSFIAAPIHAGGQVVGVVCVTDRMDGRPFLPRDASSIRALTAPVALALARESALARMREFAHGAAIDPVSGSFNRRHFQVRLEEELQRSGRDRLTLALLMIDIDNFKLVNDSFGHLTGDMVIRDVAEILRRSVRVFDVCARFGGEEFAVLMPASTVETAAKVAARIRERIESYRRQEHSLESLRITASVGLAVSGPDSLASHLIARADEALYGAKREGKNRVRIFLPEAESVSGLSEI